MKSNDEVTTIRKVAHPFGSEDDLDLVIDEIGEARCILLGEASHGTHEYYTWRARISKKLLEKKGFNIIAVEGDWPDCYRINRYIKNYPDSGNSAREVLAGFNRWPTWMWANWEIVAFAERLRKYNSAGNNVGFYGLDVYSLWESMESVSDYLREKDPDAFQAVQTAMDCFEPFNLREGFSYAARSYGMSDTCRKEVVNLLAEVRRKVALFQSDPEAAFNAEQNALVAVNAERYYDAMLSGGGSTWNIRDRHMAETAERLLAFHGPDAKIVIWEHNTHIGDARATDMKSDGLVNIGQLLKEKFEKDDVYSIGFGSYGGTVIAGSGWGAAMREMAVPDAKPGSWEDICHRAGDFNKVIFSKHIGKFEKPIGHRAIGVVYNPNFEFGNYVPSIMPRRYEAFIYLEQTRALHPLHIKPDLMQVPETYPFGV